MASWRRRNAALLAIIVGVTVAAALTIPTFIPGWAPLAHSTCVATSTTETGQFYLPLGIVNSPYGGRGSVNSTFYAPSIGFPSGTPFNGVGGSMSNGSVWGAFVLETANVSDLRNETVLGAGDNTHCDFAVGTALRIAGPYPGGESIGGEIFNTPWGPEFGTGAYSDAGEPLWFNFTTSPGNSTSQFHEGFVAATSPSVSTCGLPSKALSVTTFGFRTWIPFDRGGTIILAPDQLPLLQSFDYFFPGDFGTWQVDNLSAPGGPGGGWAFSYTPCG